MFRACMFSEKPCTILQYGNIKIFLLCSFENGGKNLISVFVLSQNAA